MRFRNLATWVTLAGLFFLAACGGDDNPAVPSEPVEQGDYPEIPKPASANSEAPLRSESVFAILPNKADFVGTVTAGTGNWEIREKSRICRTIGIVTGRDDDDIIQNKQNTHSDDLQFLGSDITNRVKRWRAVWMEDGEFVEPWANNDIKLPDVEGSPWLGFNAWYPNGEGVCAPATLGDEFPQRLYKLKKCALITAPVYLKRERFWARLPVDGNAALFALVDEGAEYKIATSYSKGINIKNSETYAQTVSASFGTGAAGVTSSVSNSITATFGYEVTVSEESTVTVTQTVTGLAGKEVVFMLWELVERYSVVDADGNPYTDPNFTFEEGTGDCEVHGVATALDATAFDAR